MWRLPDGTILVSPRAVVISGVQYPASIFTSWTLSELNKIGIYPFVEEGYDVYFYRSISHSDDIVDGRVVRSHSLEEVMSLDDLKATTIKKVKAQANNLLSSTDWYIIRNIEATDVIPEYVSEYRANVRLISNNVESIINGYTSYADLVTYIQTELPNVWPEIVE